MSKAKVAGREKSVRNKLDANPAGERKEGYSFIHVTAKGSKHGGRFSSVGSGFVCSVCGVPV